MTQEKAMQIVTVDNFDTGIMSSMYRAPMEQTMQYLNQNMNNFMGKVNDVNTQVIQDSIRKYEYYQSNEYLDSLKDASQRLGMSVDPLAITYMDINKLTPHMQGIVMHNPLIKEAYEDQIITGYDYKYNDIDYVTDNVYGGVVESERGDEIPFQYVDSTDLDFDISDKTVIFELWNDAISHIQDEDDITDI